MTLFDYKKVHFIGIGGISMSSLAQILHNKGMKVSGSDMNQSEMTDMLKEKNMDIFISHNSDNIKDDVDLVIYTAAIKEDNPELTEARRRNIKVLSRSQLVGLIMQDFSCPISIAGTHGKTSTSSILSEIFIKAEKNPTISLGGILPTIGGTLRLGDNKYFIVETCEYQDSFLDFYPKCAIILNIDRDHTDYFKSMEQMYLSFKTFCDKLPRDGILVINKDIKNLEYIIKDVKAKVVTYSIKSPADYTVENIYINPLGTNSCAVYKKNDFVSNIALSVHGEHNISNALACFALCNEMGIEKEKTIDGIKAYTGVGRRFELKGMLNDSIRIIDDYAHHPTEIKATLHTGKSLCKNDLWCVFQPHTFSRTYSLFDEFTQAFDMADKIVLLDIYPARETDTGLVSSKDLAEALIKRGKDCIYINSFDACKDYLVENCKNGDMVILTGAGDVNKLAPLILS